MYINNKFQKIVPKENETITIAVTVLRLRRNWVQRQFRIGVAPMQKQDKGSINQKIANVPGVKIKFKAKGDNKKMKAEPLTTFL